MTLTHPTDSTTTHPESPHATLDEALARIREVLAELATGAAARDVNHEHPYDLVQQLADAGFGRLRVPTEHGGYDIDLPTLAQLLAEAGAADSNIPQIFRGHFTTVEILRLERDETVRTHWLSRVGAGAVFGNAQSEPSASTSESPSTGPTTTRMQRDDAGDRFVSGTKFYSTGARFADHIRVGVTDEDGRRTFVVVPARHDGVTHVDDWDGIGQRQTGSGTTLFEAVPVQEHGDIGRFKESLRGLDSFVQLVHLANLTGIARNLVAETVDAVRRRSRTSLHALSDNASQDPEVLGAIGRIETRRLTAETLLRHAAEVLEHAHRTGVEEDYERAYIVTSTAQVAMIEAVLDAGSGAYDALGSSAVRASAHLDRHWRNARTLASHNPVVYKPRVVGHYLVNGEAPASGYYRDRPSVADAPATGGER